MKLLTKFPFGILSIILLLSPGPTIFAQEPGKSDLSASLSYYLNNNKVPYLVVKAKAKLKGKFRPVSGARFILYLDSDSISSLLNTVTTNDNGEALAVIPVLLKDQWISTKNHSFHAVFEGNKQYGSAKADLTVSRSKIAIDTAEDKKIIVTVFEWKDSSWIPVKGVDIAIAIKRMDAYLNVNETSSFTTDSTGKVSADFKRDSLPGDKDGNITIVAKVDDNDRFGNLYTEKKVPWGVKFTPINVFNRRTLFATRNKAPVWLLLMAYSIVISVWVILIYLVATLFKIKRLGKSSVALL